MTKELILMQALLEEKVLERNCAEPDTDEYKNKTMITTLGCEINNGKKYFYVGGWKSGFAAVTVGDTVIEMLKNPEQWEIESEDDSYARRRLSGMYK